MKYRKKPVLVEAFQMTRERRVDNSEWPNWLHCAWNFDRGEPGAVYPLKAGTGDGILYVDMPDGYVQDIAWDDWIVRNSNGELSSCKPDVFEATYDEFQINKEFNGMTAAEVDSLSDGYERASLVVAIVDGKVEVLKDRYGPYQQLGLAEKAITQLREVMCESRVAGGESATEVGAAREELKPTVWVEATGLLEYKFEEARKALEPLGFDVKRFLKSRRCPEPLGVCDEAKAVVDDGEGESR